MKNTNLFSKKIFRVSALAVSASMLLTSCVVYTGGYSETDGVYYDPNKDTLPMGYNGEQSENEVGGYYDFNKNKGVIERNQENRREADNRFRPKYNVSQSDSDWGTYTGTEVNYYNNSYHSPFWGWNSFGFSPYGWNRWGSPWGWGSGFNLGWNNWSGWNFGFNWGWGSPWYGGHFYSPWRYGYGLGYGFYDPFFYGGGYYGYPYYGRAYNYYPRRVSGPNRVPINPNNGVYRNPSYNNMRMGYGNSAPRIRSNGNMRTPAYQQNRNNSYPQNNGYRQSYPNTNMRSNSYDGGFRNSSPSGGFRSGGGFGGGSVGGGMRSGGGMRTGGR